MPVKSDRLIVAGAGQAGYWVAETVRKLRPELDIVLVGDEPVPPYERPPLSKELLTGHVKPESTWFKSLDYYGENQIDLRLGTRVETVNRADCNVTLSSGVCEPYKTLVLATGLRPRRLQVQGGDHPRVVTLRTLAEAQAIRAELGSGKNIVAIGAGFIGLEVASVAISAGCSVTVVEAQQTALERVMAPEVSAALISRHKVSGVSFRFGDTVTRISEDEGTTYVHLDSGDMIAADLILVGIGGEPNDDLARNAGIDCDDGILVSENGLTSDPDIYAVGDVSRQFSVALGRSIRLESWQNAQNQAISVGRRIAGEPVPYNDLPWFWTDQYENNLQIIGFPESWDNIIWRGEPTDEKFTAIYLKDGLVVGGNTLNNARDIRPLKKFILDGVPIPQVVLSDMSKSLIKIQKSEY